VACAALPVDVPSGWTRKFTAALFAECPAFGMTLAGGNISRAKNFHLTLTAVGLPEKNIPGIKRSGAAPGDLIYNVGMLGEASAWLALSEKQKKSGEYAGFRKSFWLPEPGLREGVLLARGRLATSMTDSSDGLLRSVEILSGESGCSAEIEPTERFASPLLKKFCGMNREKWLEYAVVGGEDYSLVFTIRPENEKRLLKIMPEAVRVGIMRKGPAGRLYGYVPKKDRFSHF